MGGVSREFELTSTGQLHRAGRLDADEQRPEEHGHEEDRPGDDLQATSGRLDTIRVGQALSGDEPVAADPFGLQPEAPVPSCASTDGFDGDQGCRRQRGRTRRERGEFPALVTRQKNTGASSTSCALS